MAYAMSSLGALFPVSKIFATMTTCPMLTEGDSFADINNRL